MSKYNKEELENLILVQNLSYEAIGRLYGVTGNAIKKAASRLEINLPSRRKINPCETFNKDTSKAIRHCLNCGKELDYSAKKYCSNDCQAQYEYSSYIDDGKMEKSPEMSAGVEYLIIYEDICLRSIILSVRGVVGEKLILLPN